MIILTWAQAIASVVLGNVAQEVSATNIVEATPEGGVVAMIPKYKQANHEQMVLGARLARREIARRSSTDADAPAVAASYPSRTNSRDDQAAIVEEVASSSGLDSSGAVRAIMMANNAGVEVERYTVEASQNGVPVVTYDSPLRGGRDAGESLFVSAADFGRTGHLMARMASFVLSEQGGGGDFVILSTTPDAENQNGWIDAMRGAVERGEEFSNLSLVGDEVYYPPVESVVGYEEITMELIRLKENGTLPDLSLIVAPTTAGSATAARVLHEHGYCDAVKVTGLGAPAEMLEASLAGCAPAFAFWNNLDVGYLAYHATHALISGQVGGNEGEFIDAGKLGTREILADPTRDNALRILLGDFIVYNVENVERAAYVDCITGFCGNAAEYLEERLMQKYKKKALAIIPKFTGMISFVCSGFLVQHILRSKKQRRSPYSRIIVGLSTADMLSSFFGFFLSTWPMPSDTWLAYGSAGNVHSCNMQGFFFQMGLCAATLYQASLISYYFVTAVRGWGKTRIKKWEPVFHVIPCAVSLGTAIAGLALRLYNPVTRGSMCWIKEYPPYCGESMSCERGENAMKYRWGFLYSFVLATFAWLACAMVMMWRNVRTTEKRARRYRHGNPPARSQSQELAAQAMLYSLAYTVPWICGLILSFINTAHGVFGSGSIDDAITALNIVNAIVFPLQGFLNVMVYVRPRYIEARKSVNSGGIQLAWKTLFPQADTWNPFDWPLAGQSLAAIRPSLFHRTPPKPEVKENDYDV